VPGFELFDEEFLLFGAFDQGGPLRRIGRVVRALADALPQARGGLPQLRQVFFHEPELFPDGRLRPGSAHAGCFPSPVSASRSGPGRSAHPGGNIPTIPKSLACYHAHNSS
jgi:hypothetical protein